MFGAKSYTIAFCKDNSNNSYDGNDKCKQFGIRIINQPGDNNYKLGKMVA